MKENNTDLFDLIHALSKMEKRYVISNLKKEKCKEYSDLFSYISKQNSYNEQTVLIYFQDNSLSNNFAIKKHRLFQKCMFYLVQFRKQKDKRIKLSEQVNFLPIYLQKGLIKKLKKDITRLIKECKKYGFNDLLLIVYRYKSYIVSSSNDSGRDKELKQMQEDILQANQIILQQSYFYNSDNLASVLSSHKSVGNDKFIENLITDVEQKFLHTTDFISANSYLSVLLNYHWYHSNHQKKHDLLIEKMELLKLYNKEDSPNFYISIINIIDSAFSLQNYNEAKKYITVLNSIKTKNTTINNSIFISVFIFKLHLHLAKKEYKKSEKVVIQNIKIYLSIQEEFTSHKRLVLEFYIFLTYFYNKQYKKCARWFSTDLAKLNYDENSNFLIEYILYLSFKKNPKHNNKHAERFLNSIKNKYEENEMITKFIKEKEISYIDVMFDVNTLHFELI